MYIHFEKCKNCFEQNFIFYPTKHVYMPMVIIVGYIVSAFCICENKDADQLRGNREADQRLCFRYIDSTTHLLSKSEVSSL